MRLGVVAPIFALLGSSGALASSDVVPSSILPPEYQWAAPLINVILIGIATGTIGALSVATSAILKSIAKTAVKEADKTPDKKDDKRASFLSEFLLDLARKIDDGNKKNDEKK